MARGVIIQALNVAACGAAAVLSVLLQVAPAPALGADPTPVLGPNEVADLTFNLVATSDGSAVHLTVSSEAHEVPRSELGGDDPSLRRFLLEIDDLKLYGVPGQVWRYRYTFDTEGSPAKIIITDWMALKSPLFRVANDFQIVAKPEAARTIEFLAAWPPKVVASPIRVMIRESTGGKWLVRGDDSLGIDLYVPAQHFGPVHVETGRIATTAD